jgi:hypothetical protein
LSVECPPMVVVAKRASETMPAMPARNPERPYTLAS